jgi:hypothetical protein
MVSVISTPLLTALANFLAKVRPPKEGAPSYALWKTETDAIRKMLSTQIKNITDDPSELAGMSPHGCRSISANELLLVTGAADGQSATHLP